MPVAEFDIDRSIAVLRVAVAPFPPAALFQLFDEGYTSPFEQLAACVISIRTRDEVTLPVARRLFRVARSARTLGQLSPEALADQLRGSAFGQSKAAQLVAIAERVNKDFDGALPCDFGHLVSLPGVGAKCANLVLGIACGQPRIGVDIHVHRITNRWGYIRAATPNHTLVALEAVLPRPYWVEINRLLVPFGKHVCTGQRPHCSACPLLDSCAQVGVTDSH